MGNRIDKDEWNKRLAAAKKAAFRGENGLYRLPRRGPDGIRVSFLGRWLNDQLCLARTGKLDESRRRALEIAGFDLNPPSGRRKPERKHPSRVVGSLESLIAAGERFGVIYADPPWAYGNQGTRAATGNHYGTMSIEELERLPVADLAADDCWLHLWATNGFLKPAILLMEKWGFEFKSSAVWTKPQIGLGNYWRLNHEFLLLGQRGRPVWRARDLPSHHHYQRSRHSAKPEAFREMIERACRGPYLELFARRTAPGWTVWGNQIDAGDLIDRVNLRIGDTDAREAA